MLGPEEVRSLAKTNNGAVVPRFKGVCSLSAPSFFFARLSSKQFILMLFCLTLKITFLFRKPLYFGEVPYLRTRVLALFSLGFRRVTAT